MKRGMKDNLEKRIEHETKFRDLTDEEYDALDEYFTENTIMPDMSKPGFFARKYAFPPTLSPLALFQHSLLEITCLYAPIEVYLKHG